MIFTFWSIRHGDKDADGNVTEEGLRRIAAAATAHLTGVRLDLILHSGVPRTENSARRLRNTLKQDSCPIIPFPAFGIEPKVGGGLVEAQQRINKPHDQTTVQDWLDNWGWRAGYLRGNMRKAMLEAVLYCYTNTAMRGITRDGVGINILVVGHSPGLEMAASEPTTTTSLNPADIIVYEVEVDDHFGFTVTRTGPILRCPPLE